MLKKHNLFCFLAHYILNHPLVYITLNVLIFGAVIFLIDMFPNSKK